MGDKGGILVIKKADKSGRVTVPSGYVKEIGIKGNDEVEITFGADEIIIKKPVLGCVFCDAGANLVRIGNLYACRYCINRLQNAKDGDMLYPLNID